MEEGNCDIYRVLRGETRAETKVKGSRFLALAFPLEDERHATRIREDLAEEYRDASHLCWALRLGPPEEALERHSDAGEPAGSAGAPISRAVLASGLSDLMVVVLRWFGGTKLGVGGLIRAYGEAASLSLEDAPSARRRLSRVLTGSLPFELETDLRALLARLGGRIIEIEYEENGLRLRLEVPRDSVVECKKNVRDLSRGRCELRDES